MPKPPKMIYLKAVPGRRVRDPEIPSRILTEKGDFKPDNSHWRRRIQEGDVVLVEGVAPESAPETVEEAPKTQSKKAKE